MNSELLEYLVIVEIKLQALLQDIRNIRNRIELPQTPRVANAQAPTFFDALRAEDASQSGGPRC
jgi:hypothetical protein